jgi:hypothetical protein
MSGHQSGHPELAQAPERFVMTSPQRILRPAILGALALLLAAAPARAADPVFPVNSRVGLVPPAGFTPSTKFPGFENPQASAAILFAELPAEAFPEIEKTFTNELLQGRGMTVALREPVTLKDGRGVFIAGPKVLDGVKRYESVLIASLPGLTTVVSMQMVEASRATITDAVVREAFKTLAVRQTVPDSEKLSVLPYKIGNLGGFRLVQTTPNGTAILTLGEKDVVDDVEQPFLLIGVTGGEPPKPEERDAFAQRLFNNAPGLKERKILRAESLRMGQSQGYEIVAEAKDAKSGTEVNTAMWLRFGKTGYLQMFAIARRTAWNDVFPRLRAIRDGIDQR